jgi:transposase
MTEHPSIRAAAKKLRVSPTTVHRMRQSITDYQPDNDGMVTVGMSRGLDGKLRPDRRFDTTDRDKRIRKLHREGQTMRGIANEIGCSVGTVHRVINKGK